MDSSADNVKITIGGEEYSIKTDVDIETARKIAEYVDQKLSEVKKGNLSRDNYKIAVLSALNIAGELHDYKQRYEDAQRKLNEFHNKAAYIAHKIEDGMNILESA